MDIIHMNHEIETRIERLESRLVLYRRVATAIFGCAICLTTVAAVQANRNVVTANEFHLIDGEGRVTAALVPHAPWPFDPNLNRVKYDSTAKFCLTGTDGKARLVISSAPEGTGVGIFMMDAEGRTRLELSVDAEGPKVMCYDEAEKPIPMGNWKSK